MNISLDEAYVGKTLVSLALSAGRVSGVDDTRPAARAKIGINWMGVYIKS